MAGTCISKLKKSMKNAVVLSLLLSAGLNLAAQENYRPAESNLQAREWFQDAKFGLFVHWGVYSVMAGGGDYGIAEAYPHRPVREAPGIFQSPGF
jgi:hypothetical protein